MFVEEVSRQLFSPVLQYVCMNKHASTTRIRVLTHEETRFWHSRFNRHYRDTHQERIVERCEQEARIAGYSGYAIFDAYEQLVARGQITPAA